MIVRKYTCQKCGYTKAPTHKGRGGIVMEVGDKWICNACGAEIGDTLYMQSAVINLKKGNRVEVDTPL